LRVLFILKQIDYEPIGIMHLSTALKTAGHQVRVAVVAKEDVAAVVQEWQPGILAYSVWTGGQKYYLDLNARIRRSVGAPVFSAFGGPHATFFPEMIEETDLDRVGVCVGEGEDPLVDLANALDGGRSPRSNLSDIANWWLRLDGEIVRNPVRPYVCDLDSLGQPDRALIYDLDPVIRSSKIKHFVTGRGCPYNCAYCYNHALGEIYRGKGKRVRQRSVEHVLTEVEEVKKRYPLEFAVFLDDTFILSPEWVAQFAREYPRRIGVPFFCNVRANLVSADIARLLRAAGCVSVGMGVETGNEAMREQILKRNMSRETIVRACRILHEAGLAVLTTNMVGLPHSTIDNDFETIALNTECRADFANAFIFQPYPRTELGETVQRDNLMDGTMDEISESAWDTTVLNFPPNQKRQIENLQKLFAISVEYPWLTLWVRRAINWPRNPLFWWVHKLWKGYTIKKRIHPVHLTLSETWAIARHFMKLD
jgi:anaerobic magnesium-protoporphyrin IX monomethyl ester cyclase